MHHDTPTFPAFSEHLQVWRMMYSRTQRYHVQLEVLYKIKQYSSTWIGIWLGYLWCKLVPLSNNESSLFWVGLELCSLWIFKIIYWWSGIHEKTRDNFRDNHISVSFSGALKNPWHHGFSLQRTNHFTTSDGFLFGGQTINKKKHLHRCGKRCKGNRLQRL